MARRPPDAPSGRSPGGARLVGRGTADDPPNRFERLLVQPDAEAAQEGAEDDAPPLRTQLYRDPTRTLLSTNRSPDIPFDTSLNPYRGCEHGCSYCLGPDTPILYADMTSRPIGEARVGDVLVGFDELPTPGRTRKLRRSVVEHVWWSRKPTLRLLTRHGDIVTTAEHRWLASGSSRWLCTDQIESGHSLRRLPSVAPDPSPREGFGRIFGRTPATGPESVDKVEPGGLADVVDIQTSTGTFYADGIATHNCYARPTHEYLGFSAGLDFESRILVKEDAPRLLRRALASPRWRPQTVALSGVTDPYQPAERRLRLTRRCLEVFLDFRNPVAVVTKNALVTRDVDLLAALAGFDAAAVNVSITTLDDDLRRRLEPRASSPRARLAAVEALAKAGIPVGVMVAPVIPGLTDHEAPAILEAAARAGAQRAAAIVLRLPHGVAPLFEDWLARHAPERREKVMGRIRSLRGGRANDPRFHARMRGEGVFADQIQQLFALARRRAGLSDEALPLSTAAFRRPGGEQLSLV